MPPRAESERPWFAIGGIDASNLDQVLATGASRVVVVRAITEAEDPRAAAALAVAAAARLMIYLAVMAGCVVVTLPLELLLRARVYARWRRLLLTLLPVLVVFLSWDALAIHAHDWSYHRLTGARVGNLPIEELVFFLVIPVCSILTLEAVRRLRPAWRAGDEQ